MKLPVASYSFFSKWDTCAYQAYRIYIAKDLPKEKQSIEQLRGIEVHDCLTRRITEGKPLPDDMPYEHLVAPLVAYGAVAEKKLGMTREGRPCDFFAPEVFLRGVLDAPVVNGEHALLIDWKNGSSKYETPFELEIGACLLQASYPHVRKITGRYAWLKEGRLGREHDCSNTLQTWNSVHARVRNVEAALEAQDFPRTPGPLCGYCPVKDCEHNRSKT